VLSAPALYDDFSENYINNEKWYQQETVREIANGKLVSKVKSNDRVRNHTDFQNPSTIFAIEVNVNVVETDVSDGAVFARVDGTFYNTQASGTGATGDVWAGIFLYDDGNGLKSYYEIDEATSDDGSTFNIISSGSIALATLNFNQAYTLKIAYDDALNKITFSVGSDSVVVDDTSLPAKQRPAVFPSKSLTTGINDETSGSKYIYALFDDVYVNNDQGTVYDDFANGPLDQTKWQSLAFVTETENGKLRLAAQSSWNRETARLTLRDFFTYTEGTVTIKSDSFINTKASGRARIDASFYNDTYGPGEYNGYEGNVWAQVYIDQYDDNTLEAKCYIERATNADWSTFQELYSHTFSMPIEFDKPYKLSIHFKGTAFVFRVTDIATSTEETYEYPITTTDPNLAFEQGASLVSRVYGNGSSGYMVTEWDDIHVSSEAAPATYDAAGDWNVTTSNEWANGTCDLPGNSPATATITQKGNDVTLVVHGGGGDETLEGLVFKNRYYFTRTSTDQNHTEIFYVRLNLSNATTGSGTVVIEQSEGDDVCYKGFDLTFNKTSGDASGGGGGGGGGCFISTISE